jgi:hypothetical protein
MDMDENAKAWDFSDQLVIDEFALDKELIKQPSLYDFWAHKSADARHNHEQAKAKLDQIRAQLSLNIRRDPSAFGLSKTTEATIDAVIVTEQQYADALEEVIEAKHLVDRYAGHLTALDHRKKSLEKLVELHVANYYSKPKVSTDETVRSPRRKVRR